MEQELKNELTRILDSVEFLTPTAFRFNAGPVHQPVGAGAAAPATAPGTTQGTAQGTAQGTDPNPLVVQSLGSLLYSFCYAHRFPGPPAHSPYPADPGHVAKLLAGNLTPDRWDSGWRVYAVAADGTVSVIKGETQRMARPGEFVTLDGTGTAPVVGSQVALWLQGGSTTLQPGFIYMFSSTPTDVWDEHVISRVYFHVTPTAAPDLVRWITGTFNAYELPFRMKALADPTHYTRSDSVVFYAGRRYAPTVARILAALDPHLAQAVSDPTPLFTKRFAPGIGLADDPGNGESFGMQRCRLIAEALAGPAGRQAAGGAARLDVVRQRFVAEGLDLDRPWLSAGKSDIYATLDRDQLAA